MADDATVVLTADQQEVVKRLVGSGAYRGTGEVISAGLDLLEDHERQSTNFIDLLEKEVLRGIESGPAVPMESAEELLKMFRRQA